MSPPRATKEIEPKAAILIGVIALLAAIGVTAAHWCLARGYVLYYGDAEAHLNIARRILDSRTPGPEQIGTVWLPLPHLLIVPFAMRDDWWRSGLAGTIPGVACFILAGTFLFAAARRAFVSGSAALAVVLLFALNPNILYLQSTPMTEPVFQASFAALLWATLWFRDSQSPLAVLAATAASNAASLTRYEGWFLIPFVSLYLLLIAKRKWLALVFGALAVLGPLAWLAHNYFYEGNALEFYNGPYSAMAIYRRYRVHGVPYPGDHDWRTALAYYFAAARWVAGWPLLGSGIAGVLAAFLRRGVWQKIWWPLLFSALVPAFYIWSVHSSGTPIFVPDRWPNAWYNTRYAISFVPLAALAGGAFVVLLHPRLRPAGALALAAIPAAAWAGTRAPAVTWKESEVNSIARRTWTAEAAKFLAANYDPGSGIIFEFGDLAGVLREAGIPLREGFHQGNGLGWIAAVRRPDLFLQQAWALAISGDDVSTAMLRADRRWLPLRITEADYRTRSAGRRDLSAAMNIPFTKAHGARNDFLLTWRDQAPADAHLAAAARAICDRHSGAGADGWLLLSPNGGNADGSIQLWNSDGTPSEISGNGTRCAAAFLIDAGRAGDRIRIATGVGVKSLRLLERTGRKFSFEMNMGRSCIEDLHAALPFDPGANDLAILNDVTIVNVGNPQCAVFVGDFEFGWRALGAWIEAHPRFPNRTNVSFARVVDRHTLDVRFFERGVGETMSSGTGSTGAAAAAVARGLAESPVRVLTPAGPLDLRWSADEILLAGPAEIVARGEFYL